MGYLEQNKKVIEEAFAKALLGMDERIKSGMEELLTMGVTYCIANHDTRHSHHKSQKEGYGWILLHNGQEVSRWVMNGRGEPGNADEALDRVASRMSDGWTGYVLAGLEPATYYNVMYEFIPMRESIRDMKHLDFENIFRPVSSL